MDGVIGLDALRACGVPFAEIARQMNITRSAIYQWDRVPAERLGDIAKITGLPHHILRPDLFPDSSQSERSAALDGHDRVPAVADSDPVSSSFDRGATDAFGTELEVPQDAHCVSTVGATPDLGVAPAFSNPIREAAE